MTFDQAAQLIAAIHGLTAAVNGFTLMYLIVNIFGIGK